ncbi:MAG: ATP-binding protein [Bacteroidetes bacterium]|nr:MAG: ATP-binding protein [Bacteroidota bacterium]
MISRVDTSELVEYLSFFPSIMLAGPRQVGKTTLAHSIAKELNKPVLYLDMENENDKKILSENAHEYLMSHKEDCVVIDEAQVLPELFTYLRPIIDAHRVPGRFILLGSANPVLIKRISETLAGRIYYLEISQITLLEAEKFGITLEDHWFKGGLPESLLIKNNKMWMAWMDGYIKSYVYRDLNFLFGIDLSPVIIDKIWHLLAQVNSGIENVENLSRSLGVSSNTVKKYIEFLEGAYLIHKLPALYINNGKRLVKSPKIYLRTSGILHYLLKINNLEALKSSIHVGASWEGYVVEQLYLNRPSSANWHYYRTHNGAEVDLVLVQGNTPVACVEIKYSNAPDLSRGFFECISDLKTTYNYVITPSSKTWKTKDNIIICSISDFLRNEIDKFGKKSDHA